MRVKAVAIGAVQSVLSSFGFQLVRAKKPAKLGTSLEAGSSAVGSGLSTDDSRLAELRDRYAACDLPMATHTWWDAEYVSGDLNLDHYRGDNVYVWQHRHMAKTYHLKYFLALQDIAARDALGLLDRLSEDGAFGALVCDYHLRKGVSRDLLDSVNELNFLYRFARITESKALRILDIGAGYGRLGYRFHQAVDTLAEYYCVDAVPESTFVCQHYIDFRGCDDKVHVVPLDKLEKLPEHGLHLAINVHSFSEMCREAIGGWLSLVAERKIPYLFVIPNDGDAFLSMEADGKRLDFRALIESFGYGLVASEYVYESADVRELLNVHDKMFLFSLGS